MYALRIAVWCCVLLGCGLAFSVVPDTLGLQDSGNELDLRDQRLRQLIKAHESSYPQPEPPLQNHSSFDHLNHESSFPPSIRDKMTNNNNNGRFEVPGGETVNTYQDFYRVMYGTQEGVNFLRKHYGPTGLQQARANFKGINKAMEEVRLANAHYLKIRTRARCKLPSPQLIRVKDYYPDPSREYMPRCTLLHRCGDTSGCCDSDAFHCVPSAVQEVTLHFYTISVGKNGLSYKRDNSIEKLLFENHTSCQCQPVNDRPRMLQNGHDFLQDGKNDHSTKSKCRDCPMPFTSRIYKDGRCGCDCFDRQRPCLRIKRGRDPLSDIERRCVLANHCHIPECEYGQYNLETGFCPKRHDDVPRTHHRRPSHPSPNHRWAFFERD